MAKRTASAKKQARSGVKRAARNRGVRSEVKTMVVKARRSLSDGSARESEGYAIAMDAVRALDRAAAKGVLHRNNAARRKGRLARQMAKVAAGGSGAAAGSAGARGGAKGKKAAPGAKPAAAGAKPAAAAASKKK
jgi:small subunit ribosomal protein S20